MNKFLLSIIIGLSIFALSPYSASAHVLKSDGDIGAVIHIDPEDDPIVGQVATFFFEFKDKTGKFNPTECDCLLTIFNRDKEVMSASLFKAQGGSDLNSPAFQYTFPEKSLYSIVVTGKPKAGTDFQSFRLVYDFRVDRGGEAGASQVKKTSHTSHYIIFSAGLVAVIIGFFVQRKRDLKAAKKSKQTVIKGLLAFVALSGMLFHHTGIMSDPCHDHMAMQQDHEYACCSVPSVVLSSVVLVSTEQRIYDVELDEPFTALEHFSESVQNKSPPFG